MFSVRIDKGQKPGEYIFRAAPCDGTLEMVAMDSAPGVIAMVRADDAGHACQLAWYRAAHMHDGEFKQLPLDEALQKLGDSLVAKDLFKP